jgi:hypothetical protein
MRQRYFEKKRVFLDEELAELIQGKKQAFLPK